MYVCGNARTTRRASTRVLGDQRLLLGLLERAAMTLREQLDDRDADVMARARVLGAGVAQTDDQ
jgi:hypothetical protein